MNIYALFKTQKIFKEKKREKIDENKICRKLKNTFELNKLILYFYLNSFYLLVYIIQGLRNLKTYKILKFFFIIFDFVLYFYR